MDEADNISDEILKISSDLERAFKGNDLTKSTIKNLQGRLESCADKVSSLGAENKALRDQITQLRFDLSCEVTKRVKLSNLVSEHESRLMHQDSVLKLFDLCSLFNYYVTIPALKANGISSYAEFTDSYAKIVQSVDSTDEDLYNLIAPINEAIKVNVQDIIEVGQERLPIAHTTLKSADQQANFLSICGSYDFATDAHQQLAQKILVELKKVTLKRRN